MAFNESLFISKEIKHRTSEIEIKELAEFFDKDEAPVFSVRGLSTSELGRINEAVLAVQAESVKNLVRSAANSKEAQGQAVIKAIEEFFGDADRLPTDTVRRIAMLAHGLISPKITRPVAVKLAEYFPLQFMKLTNEIDKLTGKTPDLGESKASGNKPKSKGR